MGWQLEICQGLSAFFAGWEMMVSRDLHGKHQIGDLASFIYARFNRRIGNAAVVSEVNNPLQDLFTLFSKNQNRFGILR